MIISVSFSFVGCGSKKAEADSLVVYNWADYIYDYEDDFKEYYKNLTGIEAWTLLSEQVLTESMVLSVWNKLGIRLGFTSPVLKNLN